ncbi:uncharacterized protein MYCFIDRAFT_208392 [Pseudocercospora fijiensis CIRAD86]|uniref:Uncharacterized protein n=1 Tax=Pseudocercospora fijiensis (strain CIRAD86) TaxID=383855 RepID=M3AR04_PSEFD|nr:uncharacterized protein MYCFIDRAFT_208392 [Pseudocercospora fijiensis CIRAD86]EME79857.1 hypothetical protein MYCFIDRAFT_208392 [Pseudocercospora fijiensis CIRAD86]
MVPGMGNVSLHHPRAARSYTAAMPSPTAIAVPQCRAHAWTRVGILADLAMKPFEKDLYWLAPSGPRFSFMCSAFHPKAADYWILSAVEECASLPFATVLLLGSFRFASAGTFHIFWSYRYLSITIRPGQEAIHGDHAIRLGSICHDRVWRRNELGWAWRRRR